MAKATIVCTCEECGKEFEKTVIKRNRKEADAWEEWAKENIRICPSCYHKQLRDSEPLSLHVILAPFARRWVLAWKGNTTPIKDQIKELGYEWRQPIASTGGLLDWVGVTAPSLAWTKEISYAPEILNAEIDKAKELGAEIVDCVKIEDFRLYEMQLKVMKELPEPVVPAIFPKGKWNKKIYGSAKNGFTIYVDGEKTPITADDKAVLEKYINDLSEYENEFNRRLAALK